MNNAETLIAVVKQLRELFSDKGELKGFDDWDAFLGCVNAIGEVAKALSEEETAEE